MYDDDPRQRALRQFSALLDSVAEVAGEQRGFLGGTTTLSEITAPMRTREVWSRRQRLMPELQAWVCRHYRWLVAVLMFQMFAVVALIVAIWG